MNDVLLTVSGTIPEDIDEQMARGDRPVADYTAMARAFKADLLDFAAARQVTGRFGRLLERISPKLMLAWACFLLRDKYRVIFTDGEQIGLPLALFFLLFHRGPRPQHLMIVHILSVGKKTLLMDLFRLARHIDFFFVYATWQKQFIESRWDVPPERVVFTPFMVDHHFFAPEQATGREVVPELTDSQRPRICAVGLEFRDYPTLIEAVRDLKVDVVIAAASPWSKREDSTADQVIPDNVIVRRFTQHELRDLYAASAFLAMPLYNVTFQAGVTALLEAMAMERAVVCSQTPGQTDVVVAGETGLYVTPENSQALRQAIVALLDDPERSAAMGRAGRQRVVGEMSLERYVERLNRYVQQARRAAGAGKPAGQVGVES